MDVRAFGLLALCVACSSGGNTPPDSGPPNDAGGDSPVNSGPWTQVTPMAGSSGDVQNLTVSGFYFDSATDGVVSFNNLQSGMTPGLVEHFSSPTTIDSITLDGTGKLPGTTDDQYYGFIAGTSLGLVLRNDNATQLVTSQDKGKTWTYQAAFKSATAPAGVTQNFPMAWAGTDKAGGWHDVITAGIGGDVYSASGPLGPTTTLTDTWHPMGTVTVPATIPNGDCTAWVAVADNPGQQFVATTDGSAFVYTTQSNICMSTDNGKTFTDVSANISPSSFMAHVSPLGFLFTSATAGIGWYGSELDSGGTAYVLYTTDAGKDWTVGTLPAAAQNIISLRAAFASPTGTLFLVGGGNGLILFKSTDGGKTWTDLSSKLSTWAATTALAPIRLMAGYAWDDQHIWVGSDNGFIAYTATGGT